MENKGVNVSDKQEEKHNRHYFLTASLSSKSSKALNKVLVHFSQ